MCMGLRVETAMDGSFCRCRKGSPVGHCAPDTMLTFCPATCATEADGMSNADKTVNMAGSQIDLTNGFMQTPRLRVEFRDRFDPAGNQSHAHRTETVGTDCQRDRTGPGTLPSA